MSSDIHRIVLFLGTDILQGVEVKQDPSQDSTDLMKCIEEIESREKESSTQEQVSPCE